MDIYEHGEHDEDQSYQHEFPGSNIKAVLRATVMSCSGLEVKPTLALWVQNPDV